jgi:hypothetical protein
MPYHDDLTDERLALRAQAGSEQDFDALVIATRRRSIGLPWHHAVPRMPKTWSRRRFCAFKHLDSFAFRRTLKHGSSLSRVIRASMSSVIEAANSEFLNEFDIDERGTETQ